MERDNAMSDIRSDMADEISGVQVGSGYESTTIGITAALEAADLLLASPVIRRIQAEAWDAGHKTRWRRGPDSCHCEAWSRSECACGKYGTGELLSLKENPHREKGES